MNKTPEYQRALRALYLKKIITGCQCNIMLTTPISIRNPDGTYKKIYDKGETIPATLKQMKLGDCFFEVRLPDDQLHYIPIMCAKAH